MKDSKTTFFRRIISCTYQSELMCPPAIGFREKDLHVLIEVILSHNDSCLDPPLRGSLSLPTQQLISILLVSYINPRNLH